MRFIVILVTAAALIAGPFILVNGMTAIGIWSIGLNTVLGIIWGALVASGGMAWYMDIDDR